MATTTLACDLSQQMRVAMQHLASTPTIITAGWQGARTGFAATAVTSLSTEPASLLVCVNKSSRSLDFILNSGRFGINVIPEDRSDLITGFASKDDKESQFSRCDDWLTSPSGVPLLDGAVVSIECAVEKCHSAHTHFIIVGLVETVTTRPEHSPLIYARQGFYRMEKLAQMPA